ncbi:MAG: hypothetical protein ACRDB3_17805 [Citrobacter telavivensis]
MGSIKKVLKKAVDPLGIFAKQEIKAPEVKTPAQQLERQAETTADNISLGTDDETTQAKGKRALLRPTSSSSLGGI